MMSRSLLALLLSMLLGGLPVAAEEPATQPSTPEASTTAVAPGSAGSAIDDVLAGYEQLRKSLADDSTEGVSETSGMIAELAARAASSASAKSKAHLEAIAKAAEKLQATTATDMEALRKAYGELSRPVVALVAVEASLQKGRHVFECPMAPAYKKWVQLDATVSNPYMGKSMPRCGRKTDWKE